MSHGSFTYCAIDLLPLGLLPPDWISQITNLSTGKSMRTLLDGQCQTSSPDQDRTPAEVFVVTGDVIRVQIPWLYHLYETRFLRFAADYFGNPLWPAHDELAAVNINTLRGLDARYEEHVDSNPVTGLLFATSLTDTDGGALAFGRGNHEVSIQPQAGLFLAFDARRMPHRVTPLRTDKVRISIPMNYYDHPTNQYRPHHLDEYLYESPKG